MRNGSAAKAGASKLSDIVNVLATAAVVRFRRFSGWNFVVMGASVISLCTIVKRWAVLTIFNCRQLPTSHDQLPVTDGLQSST